MLASLAEACRAEDWQLVCVGGCVRDRLLGRAAQDVDVAGLDAVARARELARREQAYFVLLDESRGCARVIRRDRAEQIDFAELRAADLDGDLRARDFTLNAVACPVAEWFEPAPRWVDPTGGQADLAARRLRACGPGSLRDDPLRILRGHRLAAGLGLTIEPLTLGWMAAQAPRLAEVAAERITEEWLLWLELPHGRHELPRMRQVGSLAAVLPEAASAAGEALARCEALLERLEAAPWEALALPREVALLRLAILLGPPAEAEDVAARLGRLRLSRKQVQALGHYRRPLPREHDAWRLCWAQWLTERGEAALGAVLVSASWGEAGEWRLEEAFATLWSEVWPVWQARPWVGGAELRAMGARPGPRMGQALAAARWAQLAGTAPDRLAALGVAREVLDRHG